MSLYLDIETDHHGRISVIGFYKRSYGLVQLVGREVTPAKLLRALPPARRIFTFNGNSFDLPVIRRQLGVDLKLRYESVDLRHCCARAGWSGGQKAIERQLGLARTLGGMNGRDAQALWSCFTGSGDEKALRSLLIYNREDVLNMVRIRAALRRCGRST